MAFCVKCGGKLTPGLKFCTGCGAPITLPDAVAPRSLEQKCSSCGALLTSGLKFCTGCGAPVASASQTPISGEPFAPPPPPLPPPPPPQSMPAMAPPPVPVMPMAPPPPLSAAPPPFVPIAPPPPQIPAPGMPPPPQTTGSFPAVKIVIAVVVLLALAAGGWFGYKKFAAKQPQATATAPNAAPAPGAPETSGQPSQATDWAVSGSSSAAPAQSAPQSRPPQTPKPNPASPQQQAEPMRNLPAVPAPASSPAPRSLSGVLIWTGSLDKHTVVTLDGRSASSGSLQGALPGIPVSIEVQPDGVGVAEAPSPSNGWKRIVLRCRKGNFSQVTIRWHAL